jgi:parallel beta-helix repeat protein
MRRQWFSALFILLLTPFASAVLIGACPATIASSSTLSGNITSSGTCVTVDADNIELDCLGFSITGDGTGDGITAENHTNVTIKNCVVESFLNNIELVNISNSLVFNNTARNASSIGIIVTSLGENNTVANNTASVSTLYGFNFFATANNTVVNNTAHSNTVGFAFSGGGEENDTIANNIAYNNSADGFVFSIKFLLFENNLAYDNTIHGFYLTATENSVLRNNTAYNNSGSGFFMEAGKNNMITNGTYHNNENGFFLSKGGAENNTISNSIAYDNTDTGFKVSPFKGIVTNTVLTNNTAYNNTLGFVVSITPFVSSKANHYTTLANNTAYNNTDGYTVATFLTDNAVLNNNTAENNTGISYSVSATALHNLSNNIAYNSTNGYFLDSVSSIILENNTANDTIENSYFLSSSSTNTLTNNTANNTGTAFNLTSSDTNTLSNNTADNASVDFSLEASPSNTFLNNTGLDGFLLGIQLYFSSDTNTFGGNSIFGTTALSIRTSIDNVFTDTTFSTNSTWFFTGLKGIDTNLTNTLFNGTFGSIRIIPTVTIPILTNASLDNLNVSFNNSFLNSTNLSFLNTTAQITLLGLSFTNPSPLADFADDGIFASCSLLQCIEVSYAGGRYVFNVTSFTSYAAAETAVPGPGGGSGGGGGSGPIICPFYCREEKYKNLLICTRYACTVLHEQKTPPGAGANAPATETRSTESTPQQHQEAPYRPPTQRALPIAPDVQPTLRAGSGNTLGIIFVLMLIILIFLGIWRQLQKKHSPH